MDFFEHQDAARRRTKWLVFLFVLAVLCIIAAVYLAVVAALMLSADAHGPDPFALAADPAVLGSVALGVLTVVGGGSLYKISQLASDGGAGVAESLGGRLVTADTVEPHERKLLNVVEEMAIASGVPVPAVYLLDEEPAINAFAAGYSPTSAVIGVTRGAVEGLTRDELQGVIAHEFSHILNGDMRLNIRLIGMIHGILVIGLIGYSIFRAAAYAPSRPRRRDDDKGGNPLPLLALGAAFIAIGYVGVFFGRLIKAAVSRQREFLADAAAVQFTRLPEGLAGALQKIGGYKAGAVLRHPNAEQMSHLFFGEGVHFIMPLFATHPPLPERIKRILPSWEGAMVGASTSTEIAAATRLGSHEHVGEAQPVSHASAPTPTRSTAAVEQVGQPTPAHLRRAAELIAGIPEALQLAARDGTAARGVIYGLLLSRDFEVRRVQLDRLATHAERAAHEATLRLSPALDELPTAARLPLVELAIPALRQLSPAQAVKLVQNIHALIGADDRVELFEWAMRRIVLKHLGPQFGRPEVPKVRHVTLRPLAESIAVLLSALAYVGHADHAAAQHAFDAAAATLGLELSMLPPERCDLRSVDKAIDEVATAAALLRRKLLTACATCIATDAEVTEREGELLRAIADAFDAPMPPLLPGQRLV